MHENKENEILNQPIPVQNGPVTWSVDKKKKPKGCGIELNGNRLAFVSLGAHMTFACIDYCHSGTRCTGGPNNAKLAPAVITAFPGTFVSVAEAQQRRLHQNRSAKVLNLK